ncbi:hypothetical protein ABH973_006232 [Bradyrhizobium ottawaense]|uniref:hypothetical protein n=1 Tax=Bradyrhizobium ottawaense TaxID=931866 RepID=UPI0035158A76
MSEALSERIIIPMAETLVEAVDDFRFANRMPSRAEAIRYLLMAGLAAGSSQTASSAPLSSLLLAAYKAQPIETFGFEPGTTPERAVELEFPPYPKSRSSPRLDTFEISTLIKAAVQQLELWEDAGGPEAKAIADAIRPLAK